MRIYLNDNAVYQNPKSNNMPYVIEKEYVSSRISLDVAHELDQQVHLNNAFLNSNPDSSSYSSRFFKKLN